MHTAFVQLKKNALLYPLTGAQPWWCQWLGELQDRSGRNQTGAGTPSSLSDLSVPPTLSFFKAVQQGDHLGVWGVHHGGEGPKLAHGQPLQFLLPKNIYAQR